MLSDRLFGLVVLFVALGYIASATQIQTSFLLDPVGPKAFPMLVGAIAAISALVLIIRPDPDPEWPPARTVVSLIICVAVLVAYAFALRPLGFLIPTAVAAAILCFQICGHALVSALSGIGLSLGLFVLFKFLLGLGLVAFPIGWIS